MDRRNFMQYATRFLAGLAAAPLLKLLPKSKTWTTSPMEFHPKFYSASFTIPKYDVPAHVWETLKQIEAEMDRKTGVVDLEILNRHASR